MYDLPYGVTMMALCVVLKTKHFVPNDRVTTEPLSVERQTKHLPVMRFNSCKLKL